MRSRIVSSRVVRAIQAYLIFAGETSSRQKRLLLFAKHRLGRYPVIKQVLTRLLGFAPGLEARLRRLGSTDMSARTEGPMAASELCLRGQELHRQLLIAMKKYRRGDD